MRLHNRRYCFDCCTVEPFQTDRQQSDCQVNLYMIVNPRLPELVVLTQKGR